ncbi:hypothetical protein ACEWY4_000048 [Coilia grayii]|uniref:Nephrocystin-4 n=1 Tax=Coilia grayii TaxID=363190 RepID=A0ABD1KVJ2_9TELE
MWLSLLPSLDVFEQELLQRLTSDCHNTGALHVQERRLHVGVHSGWTFLTPPQVLLLELQCPPQTHRHSGSLTHTAGKQDISPSPVLALRGSVEVELVPQPPFALLFQLEYVFSSSTAAEGKLSTSSRLAFLQCLGWGAWSPFAGEGRRAQEVELQLRGGAIPNPFGVMAYRAPSGDSEAKGGGVHLSFQFFPPDSRPPSSPTVAKRKHTVSPAYDELRELQVSPSRSPQGPALSLSQLAATSRLPTPSHSTRSPWQQSIPSGHQASPMAATHQQGRLGIGGIVHLEVCVKELQDQGDDEAPLQELTFTHTHAPVIVLGMQHTGVRRRSSRSALAHLLSAGFPEVRDCSGQLAPLLQPDPPTATDPPSAPFNPHREHTDPLQTNTIIVQFLAFSRIPQAGVGPDWPRCIHFSFQLYRFPPVCTPRLQLIGPQPPPQTANHDSPSILAAVNKDGTVNSDCPGLQLHFPVGARELRPGEKKHFLRYLAQHSLQIEVWDSDSLLLIGSAAVELKPLLRQGRPAVQMLHELEVLTLDFVPDANASSLPSHAGMAPITVATSVKGRLHLRLGNVGGPVEGRSRPEELKDSSGMKAFGGGSLFSVSHMNARNTGRALRMMELHGDQMALLGTGVGLCDQGVGLHGQGVELHRQGLAEDSRLRKLHRMAAVRRSEQQGGAMEHKPYMWRCEERRELCRELRVMEAWREQTKAEGITNMLSRAITTQHTLYTPLGTACPLLVPLKNPFNTPHTISIHSQDPELSVVVDLDEWRFLQQQMSSCAPLEEGMFRLDPETLLPQVYLRPKEAVHIPLKYQTFVPHHSLPAQGVAPVKSHHVVQKLQSPAVGVKCIKVFFRGQDGKPVAICQVSVELMPHVVDQTIRFSHPERTFLKKAIRLPAWTPAPEEAPDLHVRCSDPNVTCDITTTAPEEPQDVQIKVAGCPSPQMKTFFIFVFTERWRAAPAQIWQVYVHFLQRLDISCVTGQLTCQSLVLRGTQALRKVKCYVSHPLEMQVEPWEVFVLPARAVQELQVRVRCVRSGLKFLQLNVVDEQQQQLVEAWSICVNAQPPVISKAFEISLPVGGGRGSTKKISYTNPYPHTHTFRLLSDHTHLLQFKEDTFQVDGGQTYSIGLRFAPSQSPGQEDILIYINNEEDRNEETYCVQVTYS